MGIPLNLVILIHLRMFALVLIYGKFLASADAIS